MPDTDRFWLLSGDVPAGPFTTAEVFAKLAAGEVAWGTLACPEGVSDWRPLARTPGIGPTATPEPSAEADAAARPHAPPPPAVPVTPAPSPTGKSEWLMAGVGIAVCLGLLYGLYLAAYWAYDQVRPLTPTEACERVDRATTAVEAKKYVTPRLYPFMDYLYADPTGPDPADEFVPTGERAGPGPGITLVGFRGSVFDRELGRRVACEGHYRTVLSAGWKIDDVVVTAYDGVVPDAPLSLVDEFHRTAGWPSGARLPANTRPPGPALPLTKPVAPGRGVWGFVTWVWGHYGWGGVVAVFVIAVIGAGVWGGIQKK